MKIEVRGKKYKKKVRLREEKNIRYSLHYLRQNLGPFSPFSLWGSIKIGFQITSRGEHRRVDTGSAPVSNPEADVFRHFPLAIPQFVRNVWADRSDMTDDAM